MDNILQQLYHGAIHPEEEYQPTEEIKALRKNLDAKQKALMEKTKRLDPDAGREMKELFEAENAADAMDMEEAYIQGMRLGARLALALLAGKPVQ